MSNDNHDIDVLNRLIEASIDSSEGYREAADDANSANYRSTFQSRASERAQVASKLQQHVRTLGGEPEDDGSMLAGAHRMFVNLRHALSSGDTAVVDEVERGEDHIKARFEDALKDNEVTPATRAVITDGYTSVKSGHDQMRDLKHSLHNKS